MNEIVEPEILTPQETVTTTPTTDPKTETTKTEEESKSLIGKEGEAKAEALVPITVENVKLPDGMTVDEPVMGSFLEIMNDPALSAQDRVQKLVDLQASVQKQASEGSSEAWTKMQDTWVDEVKAHPEIGGAKLEPTLNSISKVIDSYGGDKAEQMALRQAMDFTGAGNNPHVIAFLGRVAKALVVEGKPVTGNPTSQAGAGSLAERMFPDLK